ncbi:MAG: hypothetical protein OHK0019_04360 [Saprospiraceae bacterium]
MPEGSCDPDTSGYFFPNRTFGFALNFDNEYVAEAAIVPGILGIADTLTTFTVLLQDSSGQTQDVTKQFFYGLPDECPAIGNTEQTSGRSPCDWMFSMPDSLQKKVEIQAFVQVFNQIGSHQRRGWRFPTNGLYVSYSNFTFWAKPVFAKNISELNLQIKIETASGKRWNRAVSLRRELTSSAPKHIEE